MTGQIPHTEREQELASKIVFDFDAYAQLESKQAIANGELSAELMYSLTSRKAIPPQRLRYFVDPDYNPGKSQGSRAEMFLRNAGTTDAMYRHGHFALNYLRYFVYGADLPDAIKETFCAKAQEFFVRPEQLVQLARKQVRDLCRDRSPREYKYTDAFYQLALDCGCDEGDARTIRQAVMTAARRKP